MKYQILTIILFCSFIFSATALEDSAKNREYHAKRYMTAMSTEGMLQDFVENMSMNVPPEAREGFRAAILSYMDISEIYKTSHSLLVKYFTAAELESLADYYSSPLAQSAHKKMGAYAAELVPVIQAEASKAIAEMQKAEMEKNRSLPDVQE